jgi:hypothetical protein
MAPPPMRRILAVLAITITHGTTTSNPPSPSCLYAHPGGVIDAQAMQRDYALFPLYAQCRDAKCIREVPAFPTVFLPGATDRAVKNNIIAALRL